MTRANETTPDPRANAVIDAALYSVGAVTPASDLQGRILTRLAAERLRNGNTAAPSVFLPWLARVTRNPALCGVSACLLAGVIVASSVSHSHRMHAAGPGVVPPVLVLPAHGLGAASAIHPAAPASTPAPADQDSRGRSAQQTKGRARIAPHAHKAPGVAVPAPDSQN